MVEAILERHQGQGLSKAVSVIAVTSDGKCACWKIIFDKSLNIRLKPLDDR